MFSPLKMTIIWLLFVAGMGIGIFKGGRSRIAVWIPGSQHRLNRQASAIRWTFVGVATVMIWQGWRLTMLAAWDVLFVVLGSLLLVVFLYIPDASFHLWNWLDRILRQPADLPNS